VLRHPYLSPACALSSLLYVICHPLYYPGYLSDFVDVLVRTYGVTADVARRLSRSYGGRAHEV
jgi:hypothetical protein